MKRVWIWLGVAVVMLALIAGAMVYTERPAFCPTCHEMVPYYDAWAQGPHDDTSCMDCHVEAGLTNRLAHKFVALQEVWSHFTTTLSYPAYGAEVPDHRCTRCHETVADPAEPLPGFKHAEHAAAAACQECHPRTGHAVTFGALAQAGVLSSAYTDRPAEELTGQIRLADQAPGPPVGHEPVSCAACHAMDKAGCGYCHDKPKDHIATDLPCARCHRGGASFEGAKFDHAGATDCAKCHKPPANHYTGAKCTGCHKTSVAFAKTVFRHPGNTGEHSYKSFPCADCHPKGYGSASCAKCHRGGVPQED